MKTKISHEEMIGKTIKNIKKNDEYLLIIFLDDTYIILSGGGYGDGYDNYLNDDSKITKHTYSVSFDDQDLFDVGFWDEQDMLEIGQKKDEDARKWEKVRLEAERRRYEELREKFEAK